MPRPSWPFDADSWRGCVAYLHGCDLYNHGLWWEAHEAWELAWKAAPLGSPERCAVQAFIQGAAALLKASIGERDGASRLRQRASANVDRALSAPGGDGPDRVLGIDVRAWRRRLTEFLAHGADRIGYPYLLPSAAGAEVQGTTPLTVHTVEIAERLFHVFGPADPDSLVRAAAARGQGDPDHWAHLWPSAIALAEHIAATNLIGSRVRVVELGCGLGLPGLVAASRGAKVVSTDANEAALSLVGRSAALSRVSVRTLRLDWLRPPDELPGADLVIGADLLYEPAMRAALVALIARFGCPALIVDPYRPASDRAACEFESRGLRVRVSPGTGARLLFISAG